MRLHTPAPINGILVIQTGCSADVFLLLSLQSVAKCFRSAAALSALVVQIGVIPLQLSTPVTLKAHPISPLLICWQRIQRLSQSVSA